MRILNIGSINADHVYRVERIVRPGETRASRSYARYAGGKGFNQSVALARAGAAVAHVGGVGPDGQWLRDALAQDGVDIAHVREAADPTGHALIQVDDAGENAIVIHAGANGVLAAADVGLAIGASAAGDWILLQNETNVVGGAIRLAHGRGRRVVLNPAPMTAAVLEMPLELVDVLILNEIEGRALTAEADPARMLASLRARYPQATVVLTLGAQGVLADGGQGVVCQPAFPAQAVDTTAAGDTFIGYFLAAWTGGVELARALRWACRASAICVTRPGAAASIPRRAEVGEP